jgi:hypothetical protein
MPITNKLDLPTSQPARLGADQSTFYENDGRGGALKML